MHLTKGAQSLPTHYTSTSSPAPWLEGTVLFKTWTSLFAATYLVIIVSAVLVPFRKSSTSIIRVGDDTLFNARSPHLNPALNSGSRVILVHRTAPLLPLVSLLFCRLLVFRNLAAG
ncbi:hypothetical protein LY76DRAFT_216400 [Colletotrichum caudatum]|nr:hypothetical protein LY76DRAFT_216400 [Colletotrichum caudatum]